MPRPARAGPALWPPMRLRAYSQRARGTTALSTGLSRNTRTAARRRCLRTRRRRLLRFLAARNRTYRRSTRTGTRALRVRAHETNNAPCTTRLDSVTISRPDGDIDTDAYCKGERARHRQTYRREVHRAQKRSERAEIRETRTQELRSVSSAALRARTAPDARAAAPARSAIRAVATVALHTRPVHIT